MESEENNDVSNSATNEENNEPGMDEVLDSPDEQGYETPPDEPPETTGEEPESSTLPETTEPAENVTQETTGDEETLVSSDSPETLVEDETAMPSEAVDELVEEFQDVSIEPGDEEKFLLSSIKTEPDDNDVTNEEQEELPEISSEHRDSSVAQEDQEQLLEIKTEPYESPASPVVDDALIPTETYHADRSSSTVISGESSDLTDQHKVVKKRKKKVKKSETPDSERSGSGSWKLPPERVAEEPSPVKYVESFTEPGVQVQKLLLPRLMSPKSCKNTRSNFRVLNTGLTTTFKGEMPPVLFPLDRIGLLPGEEAPPDLPDDLPAQPYTEVDLHASYRPEEAPDGAPSRTVDAHVTYQPPGTKRGGQWRVDIDGVGLQLIVDFAKEERPKKRVRKEKWMRKLKREPISFWPKRYKVNFTPSLKRHLLWMADEAEEHHVCRIQRALAARLAPPRSMRVCFPSHTRGDISSDYTTIASSYIEEPVSWYEEQHVKRRERAEQKAERQRRLMPTRPTKFPAPCSLPRNTTRGIYDTEQSLRARDARSYYAKQSLARAQGKINFYVTSSRTVQS